MPNPRTDITDAQYQTLTNRGLSDAQIKALSAGGLSLLIDEPATVGPVAPVDVTPQRAPRGREPDLMAAQRHFVSEALTAPRPGEVEEREARARALEQVPFTPGGEIAPGMPAATRALTGAAQRAGEGSIVSEAVRLSRQQQQEGRGAAELLSGFLLLLTG